MNINAYYEYKVYKCKENIGTQLELYDRIDNNFFLIAIFIFIFINYILEKKWHRYHIRRVK